MFDNREKPMQKAMPLPQGAISPTQRYWCATCKMLFKMDHPVCPYMPKTCINTPISVEVMPLESSVCLEKLGLFYPKIPNRIMAFLAQRDLPKIGDELLNVYLGFLNDWGINYKNEKLQTIKSFIILVSGCETAQRVNSDEITFIIADLREIWDKEKLFALLNSSIPIFRDILNITQSIKLDELKITGGVPSGKYYCPMCRKFFEFSVQREAIICPLMAQKCTAMPVNISIAEYQLDDLAKIYRHAPDIYKRLIAAFPQDPKIDDYLKTLLEDEWNFVFDEYAFRRLKAALGLN